MSEPLRMATLNRTPISVVVADKSPLVRAGLQGLLGEDERFEVVGIAENGEQFLTLVDQQSFQVGIVGWVMPGIGGRGVLDSQDAPRVVIYTGDPSADIPPQAMPLGGAGPKTGRLLHPAGLESVDRTCRDRSGDGTLLVYVEASAVRRARCRRHIFRDHRVPPEISRPLRPSCRLRQQTTNTGSTYRRLSWG